MRLLLLLLLPQPQPWGQKKFTNQCIMNALRRAQGNQAQSHNVTLLQQFDAIQSSLSSTAPRRLTHMSPFLLKVAQGCSRLPAVSNTSYNTQQTAPQAHRCSSPM
jgi:hypothetical protein